jgi:hypothetical protein
MVFLLPPSLLRPKKKEQKDQYKPPKKNKEADRKILHALKSNYEQPGLTRVTANSAAKLTLRSNSVETGSALASLFCLVSPNDL